MSRKNSDKKLLKGAVTRKEFDDLLITVDYLMDTIQKNSKNSEMFKNHLYDFYALEEKVHHLESTQMKLTGENWE